MLKVFLPLFLVVLWSSVVFSQDARFTRSGYSSLTIELTGEYPKEVELTSAFIAGALSLEKPVAFERVNDSTFSVDFYTFGPSSIHFRFNNRYFNTVILPNEVDKVLLHYQTATDYKIDYKGVYKEVFEQSNLIPELIGDCFDYRFDESALKALQSSASLKELNDANLSLIREAVQKINNKPTSPLFDSYAKKLLSNILRNMLLDKISNNMPDKFVLNTVVSSVDADTSSLITASYNFLLDRLVNDKNLEQPDLIDGGPALYLAFLRSNFGQSLGDGGDLFYDMAIAYRYIQQLESGKALTSSQMGAMEHYFSNRDLMSYILRQNDLVKLLTKESNHRRHFLPFDKDVKVGLDDIISLYKGKVVIVDVWATWCGPCIEAHQKMQPLKSQFADKDVVFLYITNESSKVEQWNSYVKALSGEHYYLANVHYDGIAKQYDITSIPRYLAFDRAGQMYEISEGFPGNDVIVGWINKGLAE